ncbi:hypothetical protein MTO96_051127 [Rhipicephalus appendiculatus]
MSEEDESRNDDDRRMNEGDESRNDDDRRMSDDDESRNDGSKSSDDNRISHRDEGAARQLWYMEDAEKCWITVDGHRVGRYK